MWKIVEFDGRYQTCLANPMFRDIERRRKYGHLSVSYQESSDRPGVYVLGASKHIDHLPNEFGGRGRFKKCDGDGKVFTSRREMDDYCLTHGYTQTYFSGLSYTWAERNDPERWMSRAWKKAHSWMPTFAKYKLGLLPVPPDLWDIYSKYPKSVPQIAIAG